MGDITLAALHDVWSVILQLYLYGPYYRLVPFSVFTQKQVLALVLPNRKRSGWDFAVYLSVRSSPTAHKPRTEARKKLQIW